MRRLVSMAGTRPVARGRPRGFDIDVALDAAVDCFWERGYRPATIRDLESSLGISQSSIYQAFGSKEELLHRALARYEDRVERELLCTLHEEGDGLVAIDTFFSELAQWVARNGNRGCLLVNLTAAESDDPVIAERAAAHRAKVRDALQQALERAACVDGRQAAGRARLLLAAVLGVHLVARSRGSQAELSGMIDAVRQQVAGWR